MPAADASPSALMKAATPGLYRCNAFRLTGLMVTASAREVARQADKLKMLAEVGGYAAQQLSVLPGSQAPTLEEVREASQKLKDLEARAVDEFFWFWPEDWERPEADEAIVALKRNDLDGAFVIWMRQEASARPVIPAHNLAVLFHMRALEWAGRDLEEPLNSVNRENERKFWREAMVRWEWLAGDDRLWDAFKVRIRQLNDASLTTGFTRRIRGEFGAALARAQGSLIRTFAERNRLEDAEWHATFLRLTLPVEANAALAAAMSPFRQQIDRQLATVEKSLRENQLRGIRYAKGMITEVGPAHRILTAVLGESHHDTVETGNEIARSALSAAVTGYNAMMEKAQRETGEDIQIQSVSEEEFMELLNSAIGFARDQTLISKIKANIATVRHDHAFATQVKPLLLSLKNICETERYPEVRLRRITGEILPKMDGLLAARSLPPSQINQLCDHVAALFRGLAIEIYNTNSRADIAGPAISAALRYVRDEDLRSRLLSDRATLERNVALTSGNSVGLTQRSNRPPAIVSINGVPDDESNEKPRDARRDGRHGTAAARKQKAQHGRVFAEDDWEAPKSGCLAVLIPGLLSFGGFARYIFSKVFSDS